MLAQQPSYHTTGRLNIDTQATDEVVREHLPLTIVVDIEVLDDARRHHGVVAENSTGFDYVGAAGVLTNGVGAEESVMAHHPVLRAEKKTSSLKMKRAEYGSATLLKLLFSRVRSCTPQPTTDSKHQDE